ncbi:MAG: hypothetical protein ACKODK_04940 [Opitutaceae bacterium]
MKWLGLHPEARTARGVEQPSAALSTAGSALKGAISFAILSTVAYGIWAFQLLPYGPGMYAAIAVVYLGLGGLALGGLVAGRGAIPRVTALFAVSFFAYALIWCAFWFGLRGKHHADLWGAAVGLAAMSALVRRAFGAKDGALEAWAVLFACHTLGYTIGDELHAAFRGATGRLLWGTAHGAGFGAGLGYLLAVAQRR